MPGLRYWDGHAWGPTVHSWAAPSQQTAVPQSAASTASLESVGRPRTPGHDDAVVRRNSSEKIVAAIFAFAFGGLASGFSIAGEWKAVGGVVILAVLVGVPIFLVMLALRRVKHVRLDRANRREYEAELASRSKQEHQAMMHQATSTPVPSAGTSRHNWA